MVDSIQYFKTIRDFFSFLSAEFNMPETGTTKNGNAFYSIKFTEKTKIISISLENVTDYFTVTIFKLHDGKKPNYDDKTHTFHLAHLNKLAAVKATKEDYILNNSIFSKFSPNTPFERLSLKAAKDLRLCLTLLPQI